MLNLQRLTILLGTGFIISGIFEFIPDLMAAIGVVRTVNATPHLIHSLMGIIFFAGSRFGYRRQTMITIGVALLFLAALDHVNVVGNINPELEFANIVGRLIKTATAATILMLGLLSTSSYAEDLR